MADLTTLPVRLRVHLAHATVQAVADEAHADVLHIKGPATDSALRPEARTSADADVIVRPSHLKRLLRGLKRHGWVQVTSLRSGGLVEHSTNWYHAQLGQLDVHIRFPGIQIEGERAFDQLWCDSSTQEIACRPCRVPDPSVQRLLLLLHAARDIPRYTDDVRIAWEDATEAQRSSVESLAHEFRAEVALAAAIGRLEEYRDRREYPLWNHYAVRKVDGLQFRGFAAQAAPDGMGFARWRSARHILTSVVFVPKHLRGQLGRPPDIREIGHGYSRVARSAARGLTPIKIGRSTIRRGRRVDRSPDRSGKPTSPVSEVFGSMIENAKRKDMRKTAIATKFPRLIRLGLWCFAVLPFNNRRSVRGKGNFVSRNGFMKNCKIIIRGNNNRIEIGNLCWLNNVRIFVHGSNNTVTIGEKVSIRDGDLWLEDCGGEISVGDRTVIAGRTHLACTEGRSLAIGSECLFSTGVVVRTGDSHSILNVQGERVNRSADVCLKDRVWIGHNVTVLKGVTVEPDSIIATGSIVTKSPRQSNVVIAGAPAKVVKENVRWIQERI